MCCFSQQTWTARPHGRYGRPPEGCRGLPDKKYRPIGWTKKTAENLLPENSTRHPQLQFLVKLEEGSISSRVALSLTVRNDSDNGSDNVILMVSLSTGEKCSGTCSQT